MEVSKYHVLVRVDQTLCSLKTGRDFEKLNEDCLFGGAVNNFIVSRVHSIRMMLMSLEDNDGDDRVTRGLPGFQRAIRCNFRIDHRLYSMNIIRLSVTGSLRN